MSGRLLCVVVAVAACGDNAPPASILFVADRAADRIVRFDGVSGEWLGDVAQVDRPSSVRLGPDGLLYVAGFGDSMILRIDPIAPTASRAPAPPTAFFQDTEILEEPVELLFDRNELVALGHDTQNAVVVAPTGTMVREVGYPDMRGAHDFVLADDGRLYVATQHDVVLGAAIQVWDLAQGVMVEKLGTLAQLANATGIAAVGDALFVTDYERGDVLRVEPAAGTLAPVVSGLSHPIAIEQGCDGLLYVADDAGIHRFEPDGTYVSLFVPIGEHLRGPRSLTFVLDDGLVETEQSRASCARSR